MTEVLRPRQPGDADAPSRHDVPRRGRSVFSVCAGRQVHHLEWGSRLAPALVLLHGAGQSAYTFDRIAPQLADRHFVVAPDLPDHGDSDPFPDSRWTRQDVAASISDLLRHLGVHRAAVVGASLGGLTALTLGVQDAARVAALVLVDVAHRTEESGHERVVDFFRQYESFGHLEEAAEVLARFSGGERTARPESLLRSLRQRTDGRWVWKHGLARRQRAIGAGNDGAPTLDADPFLIGLAEDGTRLRCPVLVLRGGASDVTTPEGVAEFTRLIPDARFAVVPGAGHLVISDQPEMALRLIREFLLEIGWSGRPRGAEALADGLGTA